MAKGTDSPSRILQWVVSILPLLALFVALGVTWGMSQAGIEEVKASVHQLESEKKVIEKDIVDLKILQTRDSEVLNHIMNDLQEIKNDLKEIKRK